MPTYNPAVADNSGAILAGGIQQGLNNAFQGFLQMRREQISTRDEHDYMTAAWEAMKQQNPEMIDPALDEKFVTGSVGTKRGILTQTQALMGQLLDEAQQARKMQQAMQMEQFRNDLGKGLTPTTLPDGATIYQNGRGTVVHQTPPAEPPLPEFNPKMISTPAGDMIIDPETRRPIDPRYLMQEPATDAGLLPPVTMSRLEGSNYGMAFAGDKPMGVYPLIEQGPGGEPPMPEGDLSENYQTIIKDGMAIMIDKRTGKVVSDRVLTEGERAKAATRMSGADLYR